MERQRKGTSMCQRSMGWCVCVQMTSCWNLHFLFVMVWAASLIIFICEINTLHILIRALSFLYYLSWWQILCFYFIKTSQCDLLSSYIMSGFPSFLWETSLTCAVGAQWKPFFPLWTSFPRLRRVSRYSCLLFFPLTALSHVHTL